MTSKRLNLDSATSNRCFKAMPNRVEALARLDSFSLNKLKFYAGERNYDYGSGNRSNVSVLSPWVRHRLISEVEIIENLLRTHSWKDAEKFIQQVIWRTYFKGWLEQHPSVWDSYLTGIMRGVREVTSDKNKSRMYQKAITGETGIDCFDSWVGELADHSYLHNHTRLWFASIWIFTLKLPWELGANFFMRHLLDGDPASNTLSWRWVAGLHTKGKHYLARSSNIEQFSTAKFSMNGQLNENAEPLIEQSEHGIQELPRQESIPKDDFLLLVTEEDCNGCVLAERQPVATVGLTLSPQSDIFKCSPAVLEFLKGAVADGAHRNGGTADVLSYTDWAEPLIELARSHGVKNILTAYTPVGPVQTELRRVKPLLELAGIKLTSVQKKYDQVFWPYATKGFFAFKKNTDHLFRALAKI